MGLMDTPSEGICIHNNLNSETTKTPIGQPRLGHLSKFERRQQRLIGVGERRRPLLSVADDVASLGAIAGALRQFVCPLQGICGFALFGLNGLAARIRHLGHTKILRWPAL
jgi:hypothetical protein